MNRVFNSIGSYNSEVEIPEFHLYTLYEFNQMFSSPELFISTIKQLGKKCRNLSLSYSEETFKKLSEMNPMFNSLFLISRCDDCQENNILNYVVGFVVIELDECTRKKNTICINLICSNIRRGGQLLLGAVLYCIGSQHELNKECLLELLDGYSNIPGFILYSKLGFVSDLSLFNPLCFYECGNLPMRVDLTIHTPTQIVGYITNKPLGLETNPIFKALSASVPPEIEYIKEKYALYENLLMKNEVCLKYVAKSVDIQYCIDLLYKTKKELIEKPTENIITRDELTSYLKQKKQEYYTQLLPYIITITPTYNGLFKVCTGVTCAIVAGATLFQYLKGGTRTKKRKKRKTKKYK